jgi:uncharacterized OB-fold protein
MTADRDSREWWEALGRHELVLQRCTGCGRLRWPPRILCSACGSLDWTWVPASRRGTVASWIVNHQRFGVGSTSPYVVLLVRLDDQPDIQMPGAFAGPSDGAGLAIGAPLRAGFEDVAVAEGEPPRALLRWRLAER